MNEYSNRLDDLFNTDPVILNRLLFSFNTLLNECVSKDTIAINTVYKIYSGQYLTN